MFLDKSVKNLEDHQRNIKTLCWVYVLLLEMASLVGAQQALALERLTQTPEAQVCGFGTSPQVSWPAQTAYMVLLFGRFVPSFP